MKLLGCLDRFAELAFVAVLLGCVAVGLYCAGFLLVTYLMVLW